MQKKKKKNISWRMICELGRENREKQGKMRKMRTRMLLVEALDLEGLRFTSWHSSGNN
jgi:hypothetical protein